MPILPAASYISGPLHQRSITTASTLHLTGRGGGVVLLGGVMRVAGGGGQGREVR